GEMADIGLEAVFTDQDDREARTAARELADIQGVALAIGHQNDVARARCQYGVKRCPDLGSAARSTEFANVGAPLRPRGAPQIAPPVIELPEVQSVALAQIISGLAEPEQGRRVLGEPGMGRAQLAHGARMIDEDRGGKDGLAVRRRLYGKGNAPAVGRPPFERARAPMPDLDMNGGVESDARLAIGESPTQQHPLAAVGRHPELSGLRRPAVAQLIAVGQSGVSVNAAHGRRNMEQHALAEASESDGEARSNADLGARRD